MQTPTDTTRSTDTDDDLVDTTGAARFFNGLVSERTLEAWRQRQQPGPRYSKLGRKVVYRIADLREFIRQHVRGAVT